MSSGRPKARVLPEPVLALPHTSRPAMPSGMVRAWTGKGAVMPCDGRTATSSGATPSCSKVVAAMGSRRVELGIGALQLRRARWRSWSWLCRSLCLGDG